MGNHILKYHLLLPAAVVVVLVVAGMPLGNALRVGVAAGCLSMVLMMVTGHDGNRHGHDDTKREMSTGAGRTAPRR